MPAGLRARVTVLCGLVLAPITIGTFVALVQRAPRHGSAASCARSCDAATDVIDEVHPAAPGAAAAEPPAVDADEMKLSIVAGRP